MSKDWCPENDGAYRDEMNAIHNRKIEDMIESYYGLENCIGVIEAQSRIVANPNPYVDIVQARYTTEQWQILRDALATVKASMIEMCESKLSK